MRAVSFFGDGVVIGAGMAAVAARAPEGKSTGADGAFAGGRVGKLIRTVSRDSAAPGEGELGGGETVMRTVSFFGSFESAMRIGRPDKTLPDAANFVTPEVRPVREIPRLRRDLSEQIVTAGAGNSFFHEFTDWRRFCQNDARVHIGRVRFSPGNQRLVD